MYAQPHMQAYVHTDTHWHMYTRIHTYIHKHIHIYPHYYVSSLYMLLRPKNIQFSWYFLTFCYFLWLYLYIFMC